MSQPRIVVALCGRKRCGKDTVASFLMAEHGFEHHKLAQQLKDGLCCFFGFTHDQVEGPAKDNVDERWGITPRQAMQWLGTEVMQFQLQALLPDIGRDFWATQLAHRIATSGARRAVVSDMRFVHEHAVLKRHFGDDLVSVRIERADAPDDDAHISEREAHDIPCDIVISNDDTVQALHVKVAEFIKSA